MITKKTGIRRSYATLAGITAALFIVMGAGTAHAGGITDTPKQVELNASNSSNPQLMVQLSSNTSINYFAQQSSPCSGVPSLSADSIKMFLSLAQAAVLAGKSITIYYNYCSGGSIPYIYDIVLMK